MSDDVKQLMLQVDASVELARRNLSAIEKDIGKFQRAADQQLAEVDKSFTAVGRTADLLKGTLGGLVTGFGISGLASLGKQALDFADDLGTAADQVNINVERYQTLKAAFRTLEVSGESFQKILEKLIQAQGDVASGTESGATKALATLGVTVDILSGKITTTDQLLEGIAVGLGKISDPARQASLAGDLVGSKLGPALAAALRDGGTALKTFEDQARASGTVIDEEFIATLADANEEVDRFTTETTSRIVIWSARLIREAKAIKDEMADLPAFFRFSPAGIAVAAFRARNATDEKPVLPGQPVKGAKFDPATGTFSGIPAPAKPIVLPPKDEKAAKAPKVATPKGPTEREAFLADLKEMARAKESFLSVPGNKLSDLYPDFKGGDFAELFNVPEMDLDTSGLDYIQDQMREAARLADGFTGDLASGLADSLVYGDKLGDVLENTFKRAAAAAIASGIFDIFKSVGQGNSVAAAFKGSFGGFFADGGKLGAGQWGIAGEAGPEIIHGPANITPLLDPSRIIPRAGSGANNAPQRIIVEVEGGEGLIVNARMAGGQSGAHSGAMAGQAAAVEIIRRAGRPRLPGALGS